MAPTEADLAKAEQLYQEWLNYGTNSYTQQVDSIARALAAARIAPPGHVIDDQGCVRKVDTTGWNPADTDESVPLPVYADGELWMMGEEAYTISGDGEVVEFYTYDHPPRWTASGWVVPWGDGEIELNKCYSNRESAEAARKAPQ